MILLIVISLHAIIEKKCCSAFSAPQHFLLSQQAGFTQKISL